MMTENTVGFKNMLRKYGNEIRFNAEHVVKKGLYAVRGEEQKLFKGYDGKAYITLAYDSVNGAERCKTLTKRIPICSTIWSVYPSSAYLVGV